MIIHVVYLRNIFLYVYRISYMIPVLELFDGLLILAYIRSRE